MFLMALPLGICYYILLVLLEIEPFLKRLVGGSDLFMSVATKQENDGFQYRNSCWSICLIWKNLHQPQMELILGIFFDLKNAC